MRQRGQPRAARRSWSSFLTEARCRIYCDRRAAPIIPAQRERFLRSQSGLGEEADNEGVGKAPSALCRAWHGWLSPPGYAQPRAARRAAPPPPLSRARLADGASGIDPGTRSAGTAIKDHRQDYEGATRLCRPTFRAFMSLRGSLRDPVPPRGSLAGDDRRPRMFAFQTAR